MAELSDEDRGAQSVLAMTHCIKPAPLCFAVTTLEKPEEVFAASKLTITSLLFAVSP